MAAGLVVRTSPGLFGAAEAAFGRPGLTLFIAQGALRSGPPGSLSPAPLALGIKLIRIQRPRAMISWHEPCLDPPWALLPLEPRVRPLVGHFGLASIGTERTPHRPAYIIG